MEGIIKKLRDYVLTVYIPICICVSIVIVSSFYSVYETSKQNELAQEINQSVKNIKNDLEGSRDALLTKYLAILDQKMVDEGTDELFVDKINLVEEDLELMSSIASEEGFYEKEYEGKSISSYIEEINTILSTYSSKSDFKTNRQYFNYLNSLYTKMQTDVIGIENIVARYNADLNTALRTKLSLGWLLMVIFIVLIIIHYIKKSSKFENYLSKNLEQASKNAIKILENNPEDVTFFEPEKDEKEFELDSDEFINIKNAIIKTQQNVDETKALAKEKVSKIKTNDISFSEEKYILNDIKTIAKNTQTIEKTKSKEITSSLKDFDNLNFKLNSSNNLEEKFEKILNTLDTKENETNENLFENIEQKINKLSFLSLQATNEAKQADSVGTEFGFIAEDITKQINLITDELENLKSKSTTQTSSKLQTEDVIKELKTMFDDEKALNEKEINDFINKIKEINSINENNFKNIIDEFNKQVEINTELIESNKKLNSNLERINEKVLDVETKIVEKEDLINKQNEKNAKIIKDFLV